jgi:hypothetical protein
MKFYHLMLAALLLQLFLFMPPSGVLIWNEEPSDAAFSQLDSKGIGPYIHYTYETNIQIDGPLYSGPAHGYETLYIGNTVLDLLLLLTIVVMWKMRAKHSHRNCTCCYVKYRPPQIPTRALKPLGK